MFNWHPGFMLNSHPLVVHFPIVLFTVPLLFEVLWLVTRRASMAYTAYATLALGAAAALVAALTGLVAADDVPRPEVTQGILESHEAFAFISFGIGVALSAWRLWPRLWQRSGRLRLGFLPGLVALAVLINYTAHLGGQMVYGYGVGTTAVKIPAAELYRGGG